MNVGRHNRPRRRAWFHPGSRACRAVAWRRRAFTLIEIMIVVAVAMLMLGIGIPAVFRPPEKDSLRGAVLGIIEACQKTREAAILSGQVKEMAIRPKDRLVSGAGAATVTIPKHVQIELLGVNFVELQDAPEARVRFFPNSTCDEFTLVLRSDRNEWRKISLEVITALPDVESDPMVFR